MNFIDTRTGALRLSDGATYYVPDRVMLSRIRQGDTVRIQYQRQEGARVAGDIERTGRTKGAGAVVTPTRDVGVRENFGNQKSDMCEPTPTDRNPCYDIGGQ